MTHRDEPMATKKITARIEEQIQGLAADLALIEQLQKLRNELIILNDQCTFVEEVYGRNHKEYKKAHFTRDQLLLSTDKLVQKWLKDRRHDPAPKA